jgi:hypothetical protein
MTTIHAPELLQPAPESRPELGLLEVAVAGDPDSLLWDALTRVESDVFIESEYVKTHEELQAEYAPYLAQSAMIGLLNEGDVVGANRSISYDPAVGFKTLNDIKAGRLKLYPEGKEIYDALDLTRTVEAGTIGLAKPYRSRAGLACAGLIYGAMYVRATQAGMDHMIASFDAGYFKGFVKRNGDFTTAVGPAVDYMGSPTIPAYIDLRKASLERFLPRPPRSLILS